MKEQKVNGITYKKPQVFLIQETGIGTSELAARTCYDSFDSSENDCIKNFNNVLNLNNNDILSPVIEDVKSINHSNLLDELAWTHFHHSILEHVNISFLVKGTSRAVLQEHARHRIQAISVRSTRYTMGSVLNAFVASKLIDDEDSRFKFFFYAIDADNMFITKGDYNKHEVKSILDKLDYQYNILGKEEFNSLVVAKSSICFISSLSDPDELFKALQSGKKKRNVGDVAKHIVSDNWLVDMVITFNLRSLKNYFDLRDSGAAYFQIRFLAQAMKEVTPLKYLKLIDKSLKI